METCAIYTFKDDHNTFHVYKHQNVCPESLKNFLEGALAYAWPLSIFDAADFAAAFIAANKLKGGGDVYLSHYGYKYDGLQYRYEITCVSENLIVTIFDILEDGNEIFLYHGCLNAFKTEKI